jgi:phage terminase small subunit
MKGASRHGGARPGAGRKPTPKPLMTEVPEGPSPLDVLTAAMRDEALPAELRVKAASAAAPYLHQKVGDVGKKEERQRAAQSASAGKFAPSAPPKLVVSNG